MKSTDEIRKEAGMLMFAEKLDELRLSMDANQCLSVLSDVLSDSVNSYLKVCAEDKNPLSDEAVAFVSSKVYVVMKVAELVVAAYEYVR